jgi:hypothetical protein
MPIFTKWYFITEHFQVLPHFITKLNFFMSLKVQMKSYKFSLNLKSKGTKQKTQEEKEWYFVSRPPLIPTTISCSFLIHFEWFQRLHMCYFKIYKTCLKKKFVFEKLKFQNHTKHLWKKPKHNPLHFERAYLAHFPLDWNFFTDLDALGGGL